MNTSSLATCATQSNNDSIANYNSTSNLNTSNYMILPNDNNNNTLLNNSSQQTYPNIFQQSGFIQYNPNQYLINEIQRLSQCNIILEGRCAQYEQRISLLETIVLPQPKAQVINVPIEEFLADKIKHTSNFLVTLIQRDEYFRIIVDMIRKGNGSYVPNEIEISELKAFVQALRLRSSKFMKGQKASQSYLLQSNIKSRFTKMLRHTWQHSGMFDKSNPKLMHEDYRLYQHNDCLSAFTQMICQVFFDGSVKVYEIQLLTSEGNFLSFIIYI